jgi:hypothetical protein
MRRARQTWRQRALASAVPWSGRPVSVTPTCPGILIQRAAQPHGQPAHRPVCHNPHCCCWARSGRPTRPRPGRARAAGRTRPRQRCQQLHGRRATHWALEHDCAGAHMHGGRGVARVVEEHGAPALGAAVGAHGDVGARDAAERPRQVLELLPAGREQQALHHHLRARVRVRVGSLSSCQPAENSRPCTTTCARGRGPSARSASAAPAAPRAGSEDMGLDCGERQAAASWRAWTAWPAAAAVQPRLCSLGSGGPGCAWPRPRTRAAAHDSSQAGAGDARCPA